MATDNQDSSAGVEASSGTPTPRLADFWEEDPELWFLQVEAIFKSYQITKNEKKYQLVVGQLPYRVLTQVADIVREPGKTPYETLKSRLITTYAQSQVRKVQKLLEETTLGDQKPSQLLRQMQSLAGTAASDQVLRTIWLRAMPQRVQGILAALDQNNLSHLAEVADKILEVDTTPTIYSSNAVIESLTKEINELRLQLNRSRSSTPSKERNRLRSKSRSRDNKGLCYYHSKFGTKAHKCKPPCTWVRPENDNQKGN